MRFRFLRDGELWAASEACHRVHRVAVHCGMAELYMKAVHFFAIFARTRAMVARNGVEIGTWPARPVRTLMEPPYPASFLGFPGANVESSARRVADAADVVCSLAALHD